MIAQSTWVTSIASVSDAGDVPEAPELDAAPLSRWERFAASVLGVGLSGAGVAAVFMTSNQAGSVALLLVGVVLLLMAINGSPLTRARYQDYELFMARRRHQVVAAIEADSPEEVRQALQVLNTLDPGARSDPLVTRMSGMVLEREVVSRLRRLYPSTLYEGTAMDVGVDIVIPTDNGKIGVQIKAGDTPLTGLELRKTVEKVANLRTGSAAATRVDGLLVVTNKPFPSTLVRRVREMSLIMPTAVVRWVDDQDDEALQTRIQALSSRLNQSG